MNSVWRIASLVCFASCVLAQQKSAPAPAQSKSRDLKYEENNTAPAPTVAVPRGYALIVGIASYKNLPSKAQLEFSERDADAIYSILISPEGGNFRAENVHRLTGAQGDAGQPEARAGNLAAIGGQGRRSRSDLFRGARIHLRRARLSRALRSGSQEYSRHRLSDGHAGQVAGSRIKAKWKVLLTDACHSGAITPDAEAQALNQSLLDHVALDVFADGQPRPRAVFRE